MNRRRIVTSRAQLPGRPGAPSPAAPIAAQPVKPKQPKTLTDWLQHLREQLAAALSKPQKKVRATSSYAPSTKADKYLWEMYVDQYGRYPSKPDLMYYATEYGEVFTYHKHLVAAVYDELAKPYKAPRIELVQELCNRADRREKFLRDELIKLNAGVRQKVYPKTEALHVLEQFARLLAHLPVDILDVYISPAELAEAAETKAYQAKAYQAKEKSSLAALQGAHLNEFIKQMMDKSGLGDLKVNFFDKPAPGSEGSTGSWIPSSQLAQGVHPDDQILAATLVSKEEVALVDKSQIPLYPAPGTNELKHGATLQERLNCVIELLGLRLSEAPGWKLIYLHAPQQHDWDLGRKLRGKLQLDTGVVFTFELNVTAKSLATESPQVIADQLFIKVQEGVSLQPQKKP